MKVAPLLLLPLVWVALACAAPQPYATPRFVDSDREAKVRAVLPEIDRVFAEFAQEKHLPGVVWGIVLDGRLVHTGAVGFANLEKKIPAAPDSRFRIASMTKSFTAMAVLKLRDAGKLSLSDPVEKYLPEFAETAPLTTDAPRITLRHLLTMTAGFPEDNPWGDRQLAVTPDGLRAFLRQGYSAANAPGIGFEYSNFGYALLGQIVSRIAGEPFQRYITREILEPLGMKDTRWEFADVPADKLALGYRWEKDQWRPEPMLHDGTYGAMGGLLTTIPDFARYVSYHLSAWPARNDAESGPVRRATLREMHKPAEISALNADTKTLAGEPNPQVLGYGYGLRWILDSKQVVRVGHSGGLPGFGSNYQFLPDYGVGIMCFANLTYAGASTANTKALALLVEKASLPRRTVPASAILDQRKREVAELIRAWDPQLAADIVAENFFLDHSRDDWLEKSRAMLMVAGAVKSIGELVPENQLRGTFPLECEHGRIDVFFTLTPEATPRLQELRLSYVAK
jgi:CubicO group peptidase (beta-lactamase class C family)